MKFKKLLPFLVSLLLIVLNVPSVYATTETRYMTSTHLGLDLSNELNTTQSTSPVTVTVSIYDGNVYVTQYLGIRVWLNHSDKTVTEVTSGTAIAIASWNATAIISANWSCPQTSMVTTDSVQIQVYANDFSPPTSQKDTRWQTEALSTTVLNSATWTVYYYLSRAYNSRTRLTTYSFGFGSSIMNSRIEGFKYGESTGTTVNVYGAIAQKFTVNHLNQWNFNRQSGITQTFTIVKQKAIEFSRSTSINQTFTIQTTSIIEAVLNFYGTITQTFLAETARALEFARSGIINPTFTVTGSISGLGTTLNLFGSIIQTFITQASTNISGEGSQSWPLFALLVALIFIPIVMFFVIRRRRA